MISLLRLLLWMRNLLFISLLFVDFLYADKTIEVFAKHISSTSKKFNADEQVVILYDGAMIKSDHAQYDKNSSLLKLDGHVEMLGREEDDRVATDHLVINTQSRAVRFKKLFLTTQDDLWMSSNQATKENFDYKLFDSRISSCNVLHPDWTIEFSEAHYREDKQFITMEDARLRFYDTTVFYFPYLAFPTLTKRTTGLLLPRFKLSLNANSEGFLYEQPFFYAPKENWDMEFAPQVRTHRGFGGYITTRFVDSNHSEGYLRTGYFKNNADYAEDYDFNREHFGAELFYQSTDFLSEFWRPHGYESGFYFNGTYLNDREYLNLQKESASSLLRSNLVESRLNAFLYDQKSYFGLYGRYNIDTSKESNRQTIQEIPSLHYHHFMTKIFENRLFYTIDGRVHNYTRTTGSRASQMELDLPLTYYDTFFDDYIDFALSENIYLTHVDFSNVTQDSSDYYYYRNYHTLELSSDLSRRYQEGFVHTLHPSITYIRPSFEKESSVVYEDLNEEQKELFVTQTQEEQLSLALSQYFYSADLDMTLFHKIGYSSYPQREESKGDIDNEMGYENDRFSLYSNLIYAWNEEKIRSLTSSVRYNQSNYDIMLTHFYNHDFLFNNKKTSFLNGSIVYKKNQESNLFFDMDYDLKQKFNHQWKLGWSHKKKCWSAKVSIGQEVIPNVEESFRNTVLYFELNLNPIGGIQQNIEESFSSQGT